jgi:hypothetical protein
MASFPSSSSRRGTLIIFSQRYPVPQPAKFQQKRKYEHGYFRQITHSSPSGELNAAHNSGCDPEGQNLNKIPACNGGNRDGGYDDKICYFCIYERALSGL